MSNEQQLSHMNDRKSISERSNSLSHCTDRLEEISATCIANAIAHTTQAMKAKKYHNRLTVPSIMIAAIAGAVAYVPVGSQVVTTGNEWVPIAIAVLSTMNTIFVGMINYFKYDQSANKHTAAAKNYALLSGEIRDYMVKMPVESQRWFTDLINFRKKKEDILLSAPLTLHKS